MNNYVRQLFGVMFQSKQTQQIVHPQQQHTSKSPVEWRQYWQAKGFSWRTEPEIDAKRQEELSKRRTIVPDIKQGIYPFKGMKLSCADIEWLLATHENGRGPVDWSDEWQRKRKGLDLRGANLRKVDLQALPLACLIGGMSPEDVIPALQARGHPDEGLIHLEGADLRYTHSEGARLAYGYLEDADLSEAHLEDADLSGAHLEGAWLDKAYLGNAIISIFTILYLWLSPQLAWYEAIVVSMTAFHGRGFSPSTFSPGDPLSIASAFEAFIGLIIEVTFIATLTQRFFGK